MFNLLTKLTKRITIFCYRCVRFFRRDFSIVCVFFLKKRKKCFVCFTNKHVCVFDFLNRKHQNVVRNATMNRLNVTFVLRNWKNKQTIFYFWIANLCFTTILRIHTIDFRTFVFKNNQMWCNYFHFSFSQLFD